MAKPLKDKPIMARPIMSKPLEASLKGRASRGFEVLGGLSGFPSRKPGRKYWPEELK